MSAQTAVMQQPAGRFPVKFLFLLFVLALAFAALVYGTHAVERHGSDATAVRRCLENGGGIENWFNPETNREATICQLQDGRYGIQIHRFGREVTSFIKNKLRRLDQVQRYLSNRGYQPR